jgi:acetolactate synthase I/II/III large subunit
VARAMGADGEVVTGLAALRQRVAEAFTAGTPVILDVPIDRAANAWTFPSFVAPKQ